MKTEELKHKKQQTAVAQTGETVDFVESLVSVRRVAKVIRGGRRFAFSALVVVGDKKGSVGLALGRGREVSSAVAKAFKRARKNMITVPLYKTTLPFPVEGSYGASKVILRNAAAGTGVIAGGAIRMVMEAIGVQDILSKAIGSANPQNVVKATFDALSKLRSAQYLASVRGKTVKEILEGSDVPTR